jgi:hypothetical protein
MLAECWLPGNRVRCQQSRSGPAPAGVIVDPVNVGIPELLGLVVLASAGWFLWDSLTARENANAAIRPACAAEGLLFLDDTVALASLRPVRDDEGHMRLRRVYGFEYSDTGDNRRKGSVTLVGRTVVAIDVGMRAAPEDVTLH